MMKDLLKSEKSIVWKLSLKSKPKEVYDLLITGNGREKFWAEKAMEEDGIIDFHFPNGQSYRSQIIKTTPGQELWIDYFKSLVKFELKAAGQGTDLILINEGVSSSDYKEVHAGWISVLLNLKAVADYGVDLRNHDPEKTWDQGFIDN